jgi:hypothetical protein
MTELISDTMRLVLEAETVALPAQTGPYVEYKCGCSEYIGDIDAHHWNRCAPHDRHLVTRSGDSEICRRCEVVHHYVDSRIEAVTGTGGLVFVWWQDDHGSKWIGRALGASTDVSKLLVDSAHCTDEPAAEPEPEPRQRRTFFVVWCSICDPKPDDRHPSTVFGAEDEREEWIEQHTAGHTGFGDGEPTYTRKEAKR